MAGDDTLTAAEEQALARARSSVRASAGTATRSRSGSSRASAGTATRSRSGSSRTGSGSSGGTRRSKTTGRSRGSGRGRATSRGKRSRGRRRGPARSATLDATRGLLLLMAIGLAAAASDALPAVLQASVGRGFGVPDLLPASFAVVAGVALDHQQERHRRVRGRWWVGRLGRRVLVLVAVGLALALLHDRDLAALRWTSAYARLALGGLLAWFLLRDLSLRAQTIVVGAWVVVGGVMAWHGAALLPRVDADLLGAHALRPVDPDGIVGILATAALMVVGAWLGRWLRARPPGPATVVAFSLTALYLGVAGIAWAQLSVVDAARWSGPTLLLATSLALLLLAASHLATEVVPARVRPRWITATGAVALPVGVSAAVAGHLLGVGRPEGVWASVAGGFAVPVLGAVWGSVALGLAAAVAAARLGAWLVDRGWILRA